MTLKKQSNILPASFLGGKTKTLDIVKNFLSAVHADDLKKVTELLPLVDSQTSECPEIGIALTVATQKGHAEILKLLLPRSKLENYDGVFRHAIRMGHINIVLFMLPMIDPKTHESEALRLAAQHGHLEIAELLLPLSDPRARESQALRLAVGGRYINIVNLLLPLSDPKEDDSEALRVAAELGYTEIVRVLLPLSDPKTQDSEALFLSCAYNRMEIIDLLYPVSDVDLVLESKPSNTRSEGFSYLDTRRTAEKQKLFLGGGLKNDTEKTRKAKKL